MRLVCSVHSLENEQVEANPTFGENVTHSNNGIMHSTINQSGWIPYSKAHILGIIKLNMN